MKILILCNELRFYLLHSVSLSVGHLSSGLGVIKLIVVLHYKLFLIKLFGI
ncbi:1-deoxy-D-xylulose-5-phosphate synthase N-terminal domain-containing protein [Candidatus Purcelliella pentastirinorum]|uniref:1-deoxy-D-xylulose-5-phosphate synthase N-terminal domain-containing protein n=1 Tax=Candidatus Purcelliella pentastirinorum TaxID=472834 RepID=UPI002A4E162B|nr:1-deoxy-D-xylulose-5-phosphate synthase N-terminal domain-containing protein [Candidatus Purcelliella pentastirinorum]